MLPAVLDHPAHDNQLIFSRTVAAADNKTDSFLLSLSIFLDPVSLIKLFVS